MAMTEQSRRVVLQRIARQELSKANKCKAFIDILTAAVDLAEGTNLNCLMDDLAAVLIGQGLTNGGGRGRGPYYVGNVLGFSQLRGSSGFRAEFQDNSFQVHHAMAALLIGFRYCDFGEWFARWLETEPADDRLYRALCPIGDGLMHRRFNYRELPLQVYRAVADKQQTAPPNKHWGL